MANIFEKAGSFLFGSPSKKDPTGVAGFQQPFFEDLFSRAQQFSQGAPLSPLERQGQAGTLAAAQGLSPFITGAQQAGQFLASPELLSPETNPFLAQTAQAASRPIMQALQEMELPGIGREAIGAGQFGSSRHGIAEGIAKRGALQQIGDVSADIFSRGYGQGLQGMLGGLQAAPQTAALGLLPSQIMSQVGREQRLAPFEQLSQFRDILGGPIMQGGGDRGAQPGLLSQVGLNIGL